jgi:Sucrase/ferredoxin-like
VVAEPLAHRCAIESQRSAEPLAGTAWHAQRWLVVEQPGSWGAKALTQSYLDPEVGAALEAAARRWGVRVLLARRPGWPPIGDTRRVHLAHAGVETQWIEHLDLDVGDDSRLLGLDLRALAFPEPPGVGAPGPVPLVLVCTNGRRDPCCADLGRPVVRALAEAGLPVWEVSHIGGDRFAGNVLCLPAGVYFGRVDASVAVDLVADYRRGLLDLERYRGRSCYPAVIQAAEAYARLELGERRIDGLTLLDSEARPGGHVVVRLQQRDGRAIEVVVDRHRDGPALLTCGATVPASPWRYLVRAARPV